MRNFFLQRTRIFWIVFGFLLIAVLGAVDAQFSPDVVFMPLYFIPIACLAWFVGKEHAIAGAIISTIMWSAADLYAKVTYSSPFIFYWNNFVILLFFIFFALIISDLRLRVSRYDELFSIDTLTGALKSENFIHILTDEIERRKHNGAPFSIAYLDIDGLQEINERSGFDKGNQILSTTVNILRNHLRKTDLIARLGGDEFAIMLPETGQEAVREVINRIRGHLCNELFTDEGRLTFSIGVVTCSGPPSSANEIIKSAVEAMRFVKQNGKDGVCFSTFPPS